MKQVITDISWEVSEPTVRIGQHGTEPNIYKKGTYESEHGIVDIYAEKGLVNMLFIYNGRYYSRVIRKGNKLYTDIGLARFARKLVGDVLNS